MERTKKKKLDPRAPMKWQIARELGLEQIIEQEGWGGLTSSQAGRIGGILASRLPKAKKGDRSENGVLSGPGEGL